MLSTFAAASANAPSPLIISIIRVLIATLRELRENHDKKSAFPTTKLAKEESYRRRLGPGYSLHKETLVPGMPI